MPKLKVKEGANLEHILRKFKKICERAGIFSEIKKRSFTKSPASPRKKRRWPQGPVFSNAGGESDGPAKTPGGAFRKADRLILVLYENACPQKPPTPLIRGGFSLSAAL